MKADMPGWGEICPMLSGVSGVCGVSGGITGWRIRDQEQVKVITKIRS